MTITNLSDGIEPSLTGYESIVIPLDHDKKNTISIFLVFKIEIKVKNGPQCNPYLE